MKTNLLDPKIAVPVVLAAAVGVVLGGKLLGPRAVAAQGVSPTPVAVASAASAPVALTPDTLAALRTADPTPETILASLPDAGTDTASGKEVARWKAAVVKDNAKVANWVNLGDALMQRVRENGDHHYYDFADSVYRHALTLNTNRADVMTGLAWACGGRHQFDESISWAKKAIALDPKDPAPYGLISDAQIEQGDLDGAFDNAQKMLDIRPDLASYSRGAHLLFLAGDYRKALWLMDKAIKAGGPYGENTAWCRAQQAEMLWSMGAVLPARTVADEAIKAAPNNYHVNLIMGRIKEAQGDNNGAIAAYKKALAISPQAAAMTALGDLQGSLGQKSEAEEMYTLVETDNDHHLKAYGATHSQFPIARFWADHDRKLPEALAIVQAKTEIANPVEMDTAAWVCLKNGKLDDAKMWIDKALKKGKPDAGRLYHGGMIYAKLNDRQESERLLYRAMNLNPHFSPIQIPIAAATMKEMGSKPVAQVAQKATTTAPDTAGKAR